MHGNFFLKIIFICYFFLCKNHSVNMYVCLLVLIEIKIVTFKSHCRSCIEPNPVHHLDYLFEPGSLISDLPLSNLFYYINLPSLIY